MKSLSFIATLLLIVAMGCKEEVIGPQQDSGNAPGPVTNLQVTPLPGAAKIVYTLPKDRNLLYVKAQYDLSGIKQEARASYFNNEVVVEGFGDTREREVTLFTVSRGEKVGDPVKVKVTPLPPAIQSIFNSFVVTTTFGGPNIHYKNIYKAKVVIELLMDSSGIWIPRDAEYTELPEGDFTSRGLPPVERKFGIFVRDRWNNHSDTMSVKLTPLPEEELDIPTYKRNSWLIPQRPPLPESGDPMVTPGNLSSWTFDKMFNGTISSGDGFHTNQYVDQPIWIPFELKKKAKLSRYVIWQRQGGFIWDHGNPHRWEIWGTNTPTDSSSWVLLGSYLMEKPSGGDSPGAQTQADTDVAAAGQEYMFNVDAPAVRYMAWKNIDSWGNIGASKGFMHISEMKIYGLPTP